MGSVAHDLARSAIDFAFILLVLWAIVSDFLKLRIPNSVSVGMVLLFVAFMVLLRPSPPWTSHLAAFALVFAISLLLFYFNAMGGGDVKFLAATSLWVGLSALPSFLVVVALLGGAVSLLLLAIRLYTRRFAAASIPASLRPGQPVPYGVAIGGAALVLQYTTEFSKYFAGP
jgi:prepilin peptidase CpaA